uniref:Uncharacterized protein n=1 Tax=Salix viminalis TaxID=40686 RepID=A0A6N2KL75_SALVM
MELRRDLQNLIERGWGLHDGLTEEIKNINSCFCRLCSENGRYCNIVETPFQEKEGLVAIKDSLKEVANVLMILQRLRSCQPIDRQEALTRLEERRLILMEKVARYRGRPLGVVEELNACFSNGKTVFDWNLSQKRKIKGDDFNVQEEKRTKTAGFVVCWIRMLFNRWRWQKAIGVAAKLILVSASVSSTVKFCHGEPLHCCRSQRKALSMVEPVDSRTKENSTALSLSNRSLDVFYGRGSHISEEKIRRQTLALMGDEAWALSFLGGASLLDLFLGPLQQLLHEQSDVNRTSQFTSNLNQVVRPIIFVLFPLSILGDLTARHLPSIFAFEFSWQQLYHTSLDYIIWPIFQFLYFMLPRLHGLLNFLVEQRMKGLFTRVGSRVSRPGPSVRQLRMLRFPFAGNVDMHGCSGRH